MDENENTTRSNDDVTELRVGVRLILIKRQLSRPFVGFSSPDRNQ